MTHTWTEYIPRWQEHVCDGDECPECGESAVDNLVWDDDGELVTCQFCGYTYTPAPLLSDADLAAEREAERATDDAVERALAIKAEIDAEADEQTKADPRLDNVVNHRFCYWH